MNDYLYADQIADVKEGDIVEMFGQSHNLKRIVKCERLGGLAFQNKNERGEFENVRGNDMASTFTAYPHYKNNIKVVDFQEVQ